MYRRHEELQSHAIEPTRIHSSTRARGPGAYSSKMILVDYLAGALTRGVVVPSRLRTHHPPGQFVSGYAGWIN